MLGGHVLLLRVHERPNLVTLHATALEIAEGAVLVLLAGFAHIHQKLGHGVDGNVGQARRGAEAAALAE